MNEATPAAVAAAKLQYPPESFVDDFSFLLQASRDHPREEASQKLERYYSDRYGVGSYQSVNCIRLVAAFNYFMRHMSDFDTGRVAVVGESGSLIPVHLIYAFYRLFIHIPMSRIEEDFDPAVLIRLAEEQRKTNESQH